jgi:hypothetical protein
MSGGAAGQSLGAANNTAMNRMAPVTGAPSQAARPPSVVQQPSQVQQPVARPAVQPTNFQYTTEGNRNLNMPTTQGQVFDQLQNYYAPRGLGYVTPNAPTQQEMRQLANQIASTGSAYQNTAGQFGTLYDNLVSGRVGQNDLNNTLTQMQALSRTAADQYGAATNVFNNPMFNPAQTVAGVPQQRNTLGLSPAQRFTLPKETWNMNPQQLMSWIQRHEKNAGRDSFMGNAAWLAGPALIGGAGAMGLTGITGPSIINSVIGGGIETATGMNRRASGGLINILRNKE